MQIDRYAWFRGYRTYILSHLEFLSITGTSVIGLEPDEYCCGRLRQDWEKDE